jgi:hypothetical protein
VTSKGSGAAIYFASPVKKAMLMPDLGKIWSTLQRCLLKSRFAAVTKHGRVQLFLNSFLLGSSH